MIHADLEAAAEALATGGLGAIPEDEATLVELLYSWYLHATELEPNTGSLQPVEIDLPATLRAAHRDTTIFEGGWRAEKVSTWGRVVAKKGSLTRVLDRSEYHVPGRPGLRAQPGDRLVVSRYWGWVDEESGFWHARRGESWPPTGADRLVRLYWNAGPAAVPALLHELSALMAMAPEASYMMKTPARPEHSGRADAFVLYLGPGDFAALEPAFRALAGRLAGSLRPATPRFAMRLAAGVAMAEGHLAGDSFGEARCRLIARTFLNLAGTGRVPGPLAATLAEGIAATFTAAGLDPNRPHLEPGSTENHAS